MSKGSRKRHRQISQEEEQLRWELAFAATPAEREVAEEALKKYYEIRKKSYIEKNMR